jgi:hypothetical protein
MSAATRQLGKTLGGGALVAFLCAGLLVYAKQQEASRCCPKAPLAHVHGTVSLVLNQLKPGGRYSGLTGSSVLMIRLQGVHQWFRYDDDWPNYRSIRRAIRQRSVVDLGYANCRPSGPTSTDCDVFEVAVGGGPPLATAGEVMAERDRSSYRLGMWAGLAAFLGVLAGLLGGYCFVRAGPSPARP